MAVADSFKTTYRVPEPMPSPKQASRGPGSISPGGPDASEDRVGAVIVTFHPGPEFREVLAAARRETSFVAVIDNGSAPARVGEIEQEIGATSPPAASPGTGSTVQFFPHSNNEGLSRAFNEGLTRVVNAGCRYVLFLDQDSILQAEAVQHLISAFHRLEKEHRLGGLNCKNVEPRVTPLDPLARRFYQQKYASGRLYSQGPVHEIRTVINSGLFMSPRVLQDLGNFNEDLFVDAIDNDLSYRLRLKGYRMFRVETAEITHNRGVETFGGGRFKYRSHGLRRQYYIVRDTVISVRKWWTRFPLSCVVHFASMLWGTGMRLLFLPGRGRRLRVVVRGFFRQPFPEELNRPDPGMPADSG